MQKPLSVVWNVLLKLVFFSGLYVYVQLFHFNGKEKNIFIAIKVKLLNLIKMLILEENFKWRRGFCIWNLQIYIYI